MNESLLHQEKKKNDELCTKNGYYSFKKKNGYYWIGGQSLLVALLLNISWKLLR